MKEKPLTVKRSKKDAHAYCIFDLKGRLMKRVPTVVISL